MAVTRTRRKAAPAPEPQDTGNDAFEDLEELDDVEETPAKPVKRTRARKATPAPVEDVEEAPAPARKRAAKKPASAPEADESDAPSEFNSAWLAEHVSDMTGIDIDSRAVRMALRKLAADGQLSREVGVDRGRYTFPKGANDSTVKRIVKMFTDGESTTPKRAAVVEDEVEEAPAKRTRKAPATKKAAAPAKATASTRGRRTRAAAE